MNRANTILHTQYAHHRSIKGKNITVAILDSGIYPFHKDFYDEHGNSRITAFIDFTADRPFFVRSFEKAYDDNGHGTHIAGILGGNGSQSGMLYTGIAPECRFIIMKILNHDGNADMKHILPALDWLLEKHNDYQIRVVNISIGTTIPKYQSENSELIKKVDQLWKDGVIVVAAAGNDGPDKRTVGSPGISRKIITVGSSDNNMPIRMNGKKVYDYSSRGPTPSCVKKPDIIAPGSNITSCGFNKNFPMRDYGSYTQKSGTSMSTPMVSGAAALLLSISPSLTPKQVKLALKETSKDLGFPHEYQGWGLLDIESLLKKA